MIIPYRTGYLQSCYDYTIDGNEITLFIDDCEYAIYLEKNIPKTQGFWERVVHVFELSLKGDYKEADEIIQDTNEYYGFLFGRNRILRLLQNVDVRLSQMSTINRNKYYDKLLSYKGV